MKTCEGVSDYYSGSSVTYEVYELPEGITFAANTAARYFTLPHADMYQDAGVKATSCSKPTRNRSASEILLCTAVANC